MPPVIQPTLSKLSRTLAGGYRRAVQWQRLSALLWRFSRGRGALALADQAMVSASNFATTIVLVRGLGLSEFGKYSIAYALLLYANSLQMSFVAAPMLSIAPMLLEEEKRGFMEGMLALQLLASVLLFAVFGLAGTVARLFTTFYSLPCVLLFAGCVGTFQLQDWLRRYYFLCHKGKLAMANDLISYVGQLGCLFVLWHLGRLSLVTTFLVMCLTSAAALIMGPVTDRLRPALGRLRETWRRCRGLSGGLLAATQARWIGSQGVLLIGAGIVGSAGIGGLRATQGLAGPMTLVVLSLENFVPMRIGEELGRSGAGGAYALVQRLIFGFTLLFALATAPVALFGRTILRVLYGPPLVAFYWAMVLQLVTMVVTAATTLWLQFYRCLQDSRAILWANAVASAASLASVYWLGHRWNVSGLAFASLFGPTSVLMCSVLYWRRHRERILLEYPSRFPCNIAGAMRAQDSGIAVGADGP
jgi:O-antigen/teichoic acid export membrane protein